MRKKMLRLVLVAAFSAVTAFGTLSSFSDVKSDSQADSVWPPAAASGVVAGEDLAVAPDAPFDSVWE